MQYASAFFPSDQDLSENTTSFNRRLLQRAVFKLLDTPADIARRVSPPMPRCGAGSEFDHVWFAYRKLEFDDKHEGPISALSGNGNPAIRPRMATKSPMTGSARCSRSRSNRRDRKPSWASRARARPQSSRAHAVYIDRAAREHPHRWRRLSGSWNDRPAPPLWRGVAGPVPVHGTIENQHPSGLQLDHR